METVGLKGSIAELSVGESKTDPWWIQLREVVAPIEAGTECEQVVTGGKFDDVPVEEKEESEQEYEGKKLKDLIKKSKL